MANASTIGALRVVLGIDSAAFESGATKAQVHLQKVGAKLQSIGGQMQKVGLAIQASIVAAATAAGSAVVAMTDKIVESAAEAETAGVSFEEFQKLRYVADKNLVSVEALTDGLKEMQLRADEFAVTGKGSAAEAFARIGYSAAQAREALKDPAAMFEEIIDRIGKLDKAAQIRVADEIFGGTGGEQFVRMLDGGAEGIRRLKAEFVANGGVISQESLERAKAFKAAMNDMQSAIQRVAISLLVDSGFTEWLTAAAAQVTAWVQKINLAAPGLTKWAAAAAAVGVALGGVLVVAGTVVSAIGALLPVAGAIAAVMSGPVVIAIGAAVAAFLLLKDQIVPALVHFGKTVAEVMGPKIAPLVEAAKALFQSFAGLVTQLFGSSSSGGLSRQLRDFGTVVARVLGAVVDIITGAMNVISNVLNALGAALRGDWSAMWGYLWEAVKAALTGIGRAFATLFPEVVEWVKRTYEGVRQWMTGRLFEVFEGVIRKVKGVSDAFFKLYDAVVGHSYVPDMVTEVGEWMARLDDLMVKPAQRAAALTAEAFEQARERARAAVQGLLTDDERDFLEHQQRVRDLQAGIAAGGPDVDVYREMLARANAGWDARNLEMPERPELSPISELPGIKALNDAWASIQQQITASREKFADAFEYGIDAALRGDWAGVLQAIVGDSFREGLKSIGRKLFDALGGGSPGGLSLSNVGSSLASIFGKLPKFSTGAVIPPSGASGIDSQLVSFWKSPREQVSILNPGQSGASAQRVLHEVVVRPDRDSFISLASDAARPIADQAGARAVQMAGRLGARSLAAVQQSQQKLGTTR